LLNAFDVIYPVRYGPQWKTNVSMPETRSFSAIPSQYTAKYFEGRPAAIEHGDPE
jgi:hypothetical protein